MEPRRSLRPMTSSWRAGSIEHQCASAAHPVRLTVAGGDQPVRRRSGCLGPAGSRGSGRGGHRGVVPMGRTQQPLQMATLAPNKYWSPPTDLSLPGEDASDPQVAMGARGAAVVVWRGWDGAHYRVQASSRGETGSGRRRTVFRRPARMHGIHRWRWGRMAWQSWLGADRTEPVTKCRRAPASRTDRGRRRSCSRWLAATHGIRG